MRKGYVLVAAGCALLFVAAFFAVRALRPRTAPRSASFDPPPPFGPPRLTVLAAGVEEGLDAIVVDASDVWFLRPTTNEGTSLRAIPKSGGSEREIVPLKDATALLAIDNTYLYFAQRGGGGGIHRVTKSGASDAISFSCDAPVLVDGTSLYCVTPDTSSGLSRELFERFDLASGRLVWKRDLFDVANGRITGVGRDADRLYVGTSWMGGLRCESHLVEVSPADATAKKVDDGSGRTVLAVDTSGAYSTVESECDDAKHRPLTRHAPSGEDFILAQDVQPAVIALTPYHVVWCSTEPPEVRMVAKAGGEVTSIGGGRGCRRVVTDEHAAYFVDGTGALVRVDGVN